MHGDADGARLIGDRARDGLPDPPRGVGRELEPFGVVELLDGPDEAEVALLDQVEEQQPASEVALRDGHHQPEVGLDELPLGVEAVVNTRLERQQLGVGYQRAVAVVVLELGDPVHCGETGLDALRQANLLGAGEQRDLADLLQVHADRVG